MKTTLSVLLFVVLFSCSDNQVNKNQYISRIVYATGGCFGQCPIQVIDIDSSLTFHYQGVKFTKDTGLFKGIISVDFWNELNKNLKENDFKKLDSNYFQSVDDQSIEIMIYYNNKVKRIRAQENSAPQEIHRFIKWFDKEFSSLKYDRSSIQHDFPTKYQILIEDQIPLLIPELME